jgi:hypothetical protein
MSVADENRGAAFGGQSRRSLPPASTAQFFNKN